MVGGVDELEEDVGWSISCLHGVMVVEEGRLRKNSLINQEPRSERKSLCCTVSENRFLWGVFWPLILSYGYPCSSQSFPSGKKLQACPRGLSLSRMYPILWQTVASSCVCTSPVAVITVVGLLDVVTVSNSAEFGSFFFCSCASTIRSLQQILLPLVLGLMAQAGTYFPKVRSMLL